MSSNYAVIIPAFNEARTLREIVISALEFSNIVIVVNDGSEDDTSRVVKDLPITLIEHTQNQGKAASLWDGIQEARKYEVDYYVTLDGDGQHSPTDIPRLLSKVEEYPNHIIIGARLSDKSAIPAKRYYANRIANFWLAWAAGYPMSDSQSGFRIYPACLFEGLKISTSRRSSFVFESEILIKAAQRGIKSKAVPIPAIYTQAARPSHFRGVRDITLITMMVARHLISRAMYPQGLYRSAIKPRLLPDYRGKPEYAGYLMGLLSLSLIVITFGISLLGVLVYIKRFTRKAECRTDNNAVVILGKRLVNDLLDEEYIDRLTTGNKLYHCNKKIEFYLLGGITADSEISESKAGANYLIEQGVNPEQIHCEENSRNTLENLAQLRENFTTGNREITLITSSYHLARSEMMARQFGFNINPCPAETTGSKRMLLKYVSEAILLHWYLTGLLYSRITHNKAWLSRISAR